MSQRKISKVNVTPQSKDFLCSHCLKPAELRCSRCGSVKYCNRDCQENNWNRHKMFCSSIKKLRKTVQEKSDFLDFNDINLFKSDVGYFWEIPVARSYCISRKNLAFTLYKCGQLNDSKLSFELALEHMLDLIWLCRDDSVGLSIYIPNIYVMLRRVQEAYDYFKFWNKIGCNYDEDEDFDEEDLFPFFSPHITACKWKSRLENLKNENVYEGLCNLHLNLFTPVEETLSLFLIKYLAMRNVKKTDFNKASNVYQVFLSSVINSDEPAVRAVQNCLPALDLIKAFVMKEASEKIAKLKVQLECISMLVNLQNSYIVPCFLNCPRLFVMRESDFYRRGSLEEAYFLVSIHFFDWFQTPGSLSCLRKRYFKYFGKQKASSKINEVAKLIKRVKCKNIEDLRCCQ